MAEGFVESHQACEYRGRLGHGVVNGLESIIQRSGQLSAGGGQGLGLLSMPGSLFWVSEPSGDLGQLIVALGITGLKPERLLKRVRGLSPILAVNARQATVFPALSVVNGVRRQPRYGGGEAIDVVLGQ
jgi:hypothetical protein